MEGSTNTTTGGKHDVKTHEDCAKNAVLKALKSLESADGLSDDCTFAQAMTDGIEILVTVWRKRDSKSEIAFQGILSSLEYCLQHSFETVDHFENFVNVLGYNTVQFWRAAIPYIYESDMAHGTKYRDALLFSLTLHDVNTGRNRLKEFYAAVPGIRKSLLGSSAKRFSEQFHHLQQRRTHSSSSLHTSSNSLLVLPDSQLHQDETLNKISHAPVSFSLDNENNDHTDGQNKSDNELSHAFEIRREKRMSIASSDASDRHHPSVFDGTEAIPSGGIVNTQHFQQRGSGGLVSCVDPVMAVNPENMWLANLGMNIDKFKITSTEYIEKIDPSMEKIDPTYISAPTTNTLADDDLKEENEPADKRQIREEMSLLGVLNTYNRGNYKLNPVIVQEQDYNVYYGGISNGLLWPAMHNLAEYILPEYKDPKILKEHWFSYVRVNYQFAIDAVRNSRPQDFIWIHDYHLMLTGMIMQSFFLHIPFQPPDDFFTTYKIVAFPILRGLLRFTKVGFQTHRDRAKFIELVRSYLPTAKVKTEDKLDVIVVTYQGWSCSLGVFPVSIKNEDFLRVARDPTVVERSQQIRKQIFGENPPDDVCLFFSVERFDYTKGIREKLLAFQRYLEKYPERRGRDILFQVAVTNRRGVDTYRVYQDESIDLAEQINKQFKDEEKYGKWLPVNFQTSGLQRSELIAHYLAMDVGVVTPKKDGMNLVAKEMMLCNSAAGLILSTGAGSEMQFSMAGLHSEQDPNYHRVDDLFDVEAFAEVFHKALIEVREQRERHGKVLNDFIMANDIERYKLIVEHFQIMYFRWSQTFLDPSWSHLVIRQTDVNTLDDFFNLMLRTRDVRRAIVERVLKGIPIRQHFAISLQNAKESLELACKPDSSKIELQALTAGGETTIANKENTIEFYIKNEIEELEKDLKFLEFIQSEDVFNIEQFISSLQIYHPESEAKFRNEVAAVVDMFFDADHFNYFFTDRDGTLKSYSCAYPASIQPAYSGVIQAQFARRCAQTCAIVTTAPMMRVGVLDVCTIPEGYYYIGASVGREWYVDPANKFKDQSIPEHDLEKLDLVFDSIADLLEDPEFKIFNWIGSGLQKHFGHVTIAHQDSSSTIPIELKTKIDQRIHAIVEDIDPNKQLFEIIIDDRDIKIFVKTEFGGIFDKGNGIELLINHLKCDLADGTILVCGDSITDIPMLEYCLIKNPKNVYTVWVVNEQNVQLRNQVHDLCKKYGNEHLVFVSCPEVLLGSMAQATIREISICRGAVTHHRHSSSTTQLEEGAPTEDR
uniref:alpha,alpha-trehalose-phosphate synthase (UDP-forming) n=1 Tax=Meloidogyne hapla TaxID=6305 RepID=A0A1I8B9V0_MELHA